MQPALLRTSPITSELSLIRETIAQNTNEDGLYLTRDRSELLRKRLELISKQITNLEREVAVYRIGENNRAVAGIFNDVVGEFLSEEACKIDVQTDNLLFPDFEKGGRS
ncbi:hypothetical protein [uncultured Cohaesibacter sp.]|uniref:hypothetical protein n=1 Tax=uncultured Cohaesibacter sp. TaxID=1002546 RepID=UPI0029C71783|nr:hypothetical protein [uncultured Cohaesibacter sp.]